MTIIKGSPLSSIYSVLSALAIGSSLLILLLLGTRPIISFDLGYHLAFGETFLNTGTIVDSTPFIYTLPDVDTPENLRPEAGPANWYDNQGRYRFPNTNWLSQIIMYSSWLVAGILGINILQLFLIAMLFILLVYAMKCLRIPYFLIATSFLLIGLIISDRLNMRPELFGYLCLITQYLLLARLSIPTDDPITPSWEWMVSMIAIQLFFTNLHSYYLLGWAITGAVLTEYVIHAAFNLFANKNIARFKGFRNVVSRLGMTLTGMILITFVNPWGWRLFLQPFQTVLYMRKYRIGGTDIGEDAHPWAFINELKGTISGNWPVRISDYAVIILFILVATAIISQVAVWFLNHRSKEIASTSSGRPSHIFKIRWAHLFMMAGMLFVGLNVRRNIGVASLIVIPSSLFCITESCRYLLAEKFRVIQPKLFAIINIAVIALSFWGGSLIFNGKFYEADHLPASFGFGISSTMLPVGASDWLNKFAPDARIWCDFSSSSTLRFFTRPHKEVPILTNTWAYPPQVMAENRFFRKAEVSFNLHADRYNIDAVVLRSDWSLPLHRQLGADPGWNIVHVEGVNVLYLRANKKYSSLAAKHKIRPGNFNPDFFVSRELEKDSSFQRSIFMVAGTLSEAGELDLAINLLETGMKYRTPDLLVWETLMNLYGTRGFQRRQAGDARFIDDNKRMQYVIERIQNLDPFYFNN